MVKDRDFVSPEDVEGWATEHAFEDGNPRIAPIAMKNKKGDITRVQVRNGQKPCPGNFVDITWEEWFEWANQRINDKNPKVKIGLVLLKSAATSDRPGYCKVTWVPLDAYTYPAGKTKKKAK